MAPVGGMLEAHDFLAVTMGDLATEAYMRLNR